MTRTRARAPPLLKPLERRSEDAEVLERPSGSAPAPRVAVCVATHRRPQGLLRLLGALAEIEEASRRGLSVVVVDNDPDGSAREVCAAVADRAPWPLAYLREKRRGIPQARNAALAHALHRADWVAFLDDDTVPAPGWLGALLERARESGADAVTGPCAPRFEQAPPRWVVESGCFERPRHPDGTRLDVAFTHNALVSARALQAMPHLFDEGLALTGGSDAEFFRRFAREGHSIVWCERARVVETVPASRATLGWVLRRAYRTGAANARIDVLHRPGARTRLAVAAHGAWCVAKGAALASAAVLRGRGRAEAARGLRLAAAGAGRLGGLAGLLPAAYARTDGA